MIRLNRAARTVRAGIVALAAAGTPIFAAMNASAGGAGGAAPLSFRVIARKFDTAPGTNGLRFFAFTTGLNHDIMRPRIDDAGNVLFEAFITALGVAENGPRVGVWIDRAGSLEALALSGDAAPGIAGGAVFAGVPSEYIPFPPSFHGGSPALQGTLLDSGQNGREGIWLVNQGALSLLALQGQQAPDAPPGALLGPLDAQINETHAVIATSRLTGAGVTPANDEAVFRAPGGGGPLHLYLRKGDPAPVGQAGVVYAADGVGVTGAFPQIATNRNSDVVFAAHLGEPGISAFGDEAIFVDRGHGPALLLREGNPAPPGAPAGATLGGGNALLQIQRLQINNLGHIAFSAQLGGGVPTQTALFSSHRGSMQVVAAAGAAAPGVSGVFTILGSPVLSQAGRLAFIATTSADRFPPMGIWWDQNGSIAPLVLPGDPILGDPLHARVTGVSEIVGFASNGLLLFRADMSDDQSASASGVFLAAPDGDVRLVAASGRPFDLAGDGSDIRQIIRVAPGGLSEVASLVFRLDFTDNSSAHVLASTGLNVLGDLNADGAVNSSDLALLLGQWGAGAGAAADLNGDGVVNSADLSLLLGAFGR